MLCIFENLSARLPPVDILRYEFGILPNQCQLDVVEKESGQKQLENDMKITAKSASLAGTFSEGVLGYGCLVCRVLLLVCSVLKLRIVSLTDSGTRGSVLNLPRRCFALVVAAASVTDVAVAWLLLLLLSPLLLLLLLLLVVLLLLLLVLVLLLVVVVDFFLHDSSPASPAPLHREASWAAGGCWILQNYRINQDHPLTSLYD